MIVSCGRCSGKGVRPGGLRRLDEDGAADLSGFVVSACASFSPSVSSISPMSSSSCSTSLSSFSDERPNCARRNTASCIFSFSISSVLAWISAERAATSRCRSPATRRKSSGSQGKSAVDGDMTMSSITTSPANIKSIQIKAISTNNWLSGDRRSNCPAPVNSLDEKRELRRCQLQRAVDDRRPNELAFLEPLGEQTKPRAIPGQNLQIVSALAPEDEHAAGKGIGFQHLCDFRR